MRARFPQAPKPGDPLRASLFASILELIRGNMIRGGKGIRIKPSSTGVIIEATADGAEGDTAAVSGYYVLSPPGGIAHGTTESCQTYLGDDVTLSGVYIDVKNGWDTTDVPGSVKVTVSRKPGGYKADGWECVSA